MKTLTDIKRFANDIINAAHDYPAEARYEVVSEFLEITRREEGLTTQETRRLIELLDERGIW